MYQENTKETHGKERKSQLGEQWNTLLYLQGFYQVEIIVSDIIVIAFDFSECFLVFLRQFKHVQILPLFNLLYLCFPTQVHFFSQLLDL
jgi:hypothetical protein